MVVLLAALLYGSAKSQETPRSAIQPALEGNRGAFKIAFNTSGTTAYVTEFDEGRVAVIDTASGKMLRHVSTQGTQPTGIAVVPNSSTVIVTNSFSGSVAFIDTKSGECSTIPLRGVPWDVVLSPDGSRAYVSVSQLDKVAVIDIGSRKIIGEMHTGHRPRALAISPDGRTVVSGNMTDGSISYLDTATLSLRASASVPSVNLRGIDIFPDGRNVFVVAQKAQNERPTETAIGIWSNQAFLQVPNGPRNGVQNLWLDLMGKDVSDPDSIVLDSTKSRAFITCSGGNSVNVVPVRGGETLTVENVGACPRGLAFTPNYKELWIANNLSNDIAVINPETLKIERRINLGPSTHKGDAILGKYLFSTATIVKGEQFSCNSCHPDGGTDGISWKFVHVKDVLGKETDRNAKSLIGNIGSAGPFRWSGHEPSLAAFVEEEIPGLMQGSKPTAAQVSAIEKYVNTLSAPPNPYRNEDGTISVKGLKGKALFEGKAECSSCHSGPRFGGTKKAWIGTTPEGVMLQVPRLTAVYDSYPYLHNGKAKTLEEVFSVYNEKELHGKAKQLSPEEMKDLLQYVMEL